MSLKHIILTIDENVVLYPSRKAKRCTCLGSDNKKFQADIPEAEVKLQMYIESLKHKLTQAEIGKLKELADEFGSEQRRHGGEHIE